jgi:hypothetical protein
MGTRGFSPQWKRSEREAACSAPYIVLIETHGTIFFPQFLIKQRASSVFSAALYVT